MCVCLNYKFLDGENPWFPLQVLFEVKASDINVLMSPLDFASSNLVLLLPVKSEVVSISVNQSSNCEVISI